MRHPSLLLLLVGLAGAANRTAENAANGWGRWTIKDGKNETVYFNCSLTAKDGELGACDTMVGHGRGTCYKNQVVVLPGAAGKLHMTGDQYVCGCYRPYGFGVLPSLGDDMCLSESCVAGPMGCADRTVVTIIVYIVSGVLQLLFFVELCFIIYLLVGLKMKGNFEMNAQTSTTINAGIGVFFTQLWLPNYYVVPATGDWMWAHSVMNPLALPATSLFICIASLNLSFMWFQIANGVSKMKKTGTNISTRPKIAVICISFAFGLLMFICFAIIRQTAVGSGLALLFFIFVITTYVIGARKLSGAVGKANSVAQNIVTTATKMALSMVLSVVGMLLYAVFKAMKRNNQIMGLLEILMIHLLLLGQVFSVYHMLKFIAGNTAKKRGIKITRAKSFSYGASATVSEMPETTKDTAGATGIGSRTGGTGSGAEIAPYKIEQAVENV